MKTVKKYNIPYFIQLHFTFLLLTKHDDYVYWSHFFIDELEFKHIPWNDFFDANALTLTISDMIILVF